jgi:uncharacterized membrane protein YphA (DoxX/SURF4 family)
MTSIAPDTVSSTTDAVDAHMLPLVGAVGRSLFATGLLGLGILGVLHGDFALQWVPVPRSVPARTELAYLNALLLICGAIASVIPRTRRIGSLMLALIVSTWVILVHAPRVAIDLTNVGKWNSLSESLAIASAGWVMTFRAPPACTHARLGRMVFAVTLLVFGFAHFRYSEFTASMVPGWIPVPLFWAYFTGCGHIAAGVSILSGVLSRLGATLLGVMMSSFVLLLHLPRVIVDPGSRLEWTMMCMALTLTGSAYAIASSRR